jgi:hypothetical protein
MNLDSLLNRRVSRRTALKFGAAGALATQAGMLEQLATMPNRMAMAAGALPSIQFDIGAFIPPAFTVEGVLVRFGPVFTLFVPAKLTRDPEPGDQDRLADALGTIESHFAFSPAGVFTFVSWGLPYFRRLPQQLVAAHMPRLLSDHSRSVLEEAVPSPTDVIGGLVGGPNAPVPNVTKDRFNVNVRIESNDLLFTFRSDSIPNIIEAFGFLAETMGGLIQMQTPRLMFQQPGLTRKVADANNLEFAPRINPISPMWMGFYDQQVDSSASAPIVTFQGTPTAKLTTARAGDYFADGAIQVLSHDILDLYQFFATPKQDPRHPDGEEYTERVMYMLRANQVGTINGLPAQQTGDGFTNGGGASAVANKFQGTNDAFLDAQDAFGKFTAGMTPAQQQSATFTGLPRIGHEQALQRASRAADGTPLHIRMDGAGFDGMDVPAFQEFPGGVTIPAGSNQPKLEFTAFVPTSEFFRNMRALSAAQDLQVQFKVDPDDNGLERFMTATRRQNFLTPPRAHRSFPLLELTGWRRHR